MEPALDDLQILQICSVKSSRRVRVGSWSNEEVARQQLPSTISFESRMTKPGLLAFETKAGPRGSTDLKNGPDIFYVFVFYVPRCKKSPNKFGHQVRQPPISKNLVIRICRPKKTGHLYDCTEQW